MPARCGQSAPENDAGYGYLWWTGDADGSPAGWAQGWGGQLIEVVPDRDLVVVVATESDAGPREWCHYPGPMIVWLNGTHGAGKTTTAALVQKLIPNSRVFDAEKVGETLMDMYPGLPETDNFQNWPPWRPLVVDTARRILDYTGGTLVIPMTVLVEPYWREISQGLDAYDIPVHHFVLHADQDTLRARIQDDSVMGPSRFRFAYLTPYAEAFTSWLGDDADVIDTQELTPAQAAAQIADAVQSHGAARMPANQ